MATKGIIMAGGQGTRFKPLTNYIQKCMIPIGESEKPILEYIIRLFHYHGIDDIILLVGYKHKQIVNYFEDGSRFGVKLQYVEDDPSLKGSANALINAYEKEAFQDGDTLMVYYGDILSNIDLKDMLNQMSQEKAAATVALSTKYKLSVGVGELEGTRIKRFVEKPYMDINASIGILALSGSIIEKLQSHRSSTPSSYDLMGDVIEPMVNAGDNVSAYQTDAFWYDVGSIERYERLSAKELHENLDYLITKTST